MGVGRRDRARGVIDLHGHQRLAWNIGNDRLEILRDGWPFAILGVDGAGHRRGEGGEGGGDDGSDVHEVLPPAIGLPSFFIVSSRPCPSTDCGHRTDQSRGKNSTWGPGSMMNTASVA